MCNKEKYPHDEVIRAYLDGKTIEMFLEITRVWKELEPCSPTKRVVFDPYLKYRIKPEAVKYEDKGMTHDEMIAVIQHHKNGGKIEVRYRGRDGLWGEDDHPVWNFDFCDYRAKPVPVERWAIEWESGNITYYLSKKSAEEDFKELSCTVRMFKMKEVEE